MPATTRSPLMYWLAVISVSVGTFAVVTTEMLPVGLLSSIGATLDVSDGRAGLMVTVPGLVAAFAAPAVTVAAGRLDRRLVLGVLISLLAAANLLAALSPSFPVMLLARVLSGVTVGGFWAIAVGLAVRLVPERSVGTATAMIFSGISVASVAGVPAGSLIGEVAGWRAAFTAMGILSLAVLAAIALLVPPLPTAQPIRFRQLTGPLGDPRLRAGLITTALVVTGHFAAYTYVTPVLRDVSGVAQGLISALLLVYGVAGVAGNFAAGWAAPRDLRGTLLTIIVLLAAAMPLIPALGPGTAGVIALLVVWGLAYGGVSVSLQTWMVSSAPQNPEASSALFVFAFNLAIALGALVGGLVVDAAGPSGAMWFGGLLALAALPAVALSRRAKPPANTARTCAESPSPR
ncbi:MFS transporter [Streptosporangium sp. KLBMP 9127]|nr:MFS transporter [Streptosporangium sp. KLBMP 9127]